jgi:hypothetical protein
MEQEQRLWRGFWDLYLEERVVGLIKSGKEECCMKGVGVGVDFIIICERDKKTSFTSYV